MVLKYGYFFTYIHLKYSAEQEYYKKNEKHFIEFYIVKTIECLNSTLINLVLDNFITAETCFVLNMIFLNSIGADHVHTDGQDRELNTSTMFSHCHRTSYCSFADGNLAWPSRSTFKEYFRIRDYVSFETFIPVILLIIIRNGSIGLLFCLHAKPDAQIKNFKKSVPTIYPRANAECLYDSIPKVERLKNLTSPGIEFLCGSARCSMYRIIHDEHVEVVYRTVVSPCWYYSVSYLHV